MKSTLLLCIALAFSGLHTTAGAQTNTPPSKPTTNIPPKVLEPAEAQKLIATGNGVVIDVSTPAEFAAKRIAGAINIDFRARDFATKVARLDKNKSYIVYCATGVRSGQACTAMSQQGFKSLGNLKGGLAAWEKAGLPVEK